LWTDSSDSALVEQAMTTIINEVDSTAVSMGLKHEFVYLNYANEKQDPLRSYGEGELDKLKRVSTLYDPKGIFQTQVPGGFKLRYS
jgi:hypothetical protein